VESFQHAPFRLCRRFLIPPCFTFPQAPLSSRTVGCPESGWPSVLSWYYHRAAFPQRAAAEVHAHLHLSRLRFTTPLAIGSVYHSKQAPVLCGVTRMAITVPRAPSPPWGVTPPKIVCPRPRPALPGPRRYYGLMRQTSALSRPLHGGLVRESWQIAACPLLGRGPSRCYRLNLCGGAWTHTPPRFCGAHARFFPQNLGLTCQRFGALRLPPCWPLP
jgi:hypothetical protein